MKKSLLFILGAGALGYVAYANGFLDRIINRVRRAAAPELEQQPGHEKEAPAERRRRPRLLRRRKPSHWTADGLLDLNSASQQELARLKEIGPELAEKIVENRPYLTKIDLVGRMVIPDAAYEAIKRRITVRPQAA